MKTMYAVTGNSDTVEGRGHQVVICLTEDRGLAEEVCRGKAYAHWYGGMGMPGGEKDVKVLPVVESMEDFEDLASL